MTAHTHTQFAPTFTYQSSLIKSTYQSKQQSLSNVLLWVARKRILNTFVGDEKSGKKETDIAIGNW